MSNNFVCFVLKGEMKPQRHEEHKVNPCKIRSFCVIRVQFSLRAL
jgi:hypothetical protein